MAMAKAALRVLSCWLLASRRLNVATMLVDSTAVAETATLPEFKPLYRRLSGLGATPGRSVAEILKEWQSEGKIVTESQLLNFVRQLRRYKSYKTALELMDWMDANGIKLSSSSHAVRLDIVAKFKGIDEAEKYFANLPEISKNQQTYGALLSGYCQGKMSDKAIALFNKMQEQTISCNTLTYNNLMSLHMKLGHPEKVPSLLQEMKAANISPDAITYCLLMNSCTSRNDIDSLESFVREIEKDTPGPLSWSIYSNMASHFIAAGLFEKAKFALKKLEAVMDGHDRACYHHLISMFASVRNLAEFMDWMEGQQLGGNHAVRIDLLSKVKGIGMAEEYFYSIPDTAKNHQTYGALLSCYCSKKVKDKAIAIHNKMKELGLASSALAYNNVMSLHMKSGQPEEVRRLFDEMKATKTFPDKCSYKILIEGYALMNDIDSIESIVQEMEGKEGAWHWSLYCHLAAIYNSAKLFEKARIVLKKAELTMNGRDSSPFPFLISLYAGAGDLLEAKRMWASLNARIQNSRLPTNKEYLVMLQALKKLHDVAALKVLFEEWESNFVSYDMKLVNAVIGAYLEKHMVEEARQLLERAMEEGAHLVLKSVLLFIDYYFKKGEEDQARRWSLATSYLVKRGRSGGLELLRMIT